MSAVDHAHHKGTKPVRGPSTVHGPGVVTHETGRFEITRLSDLEQLIGRFRKFGAPDDAVILDRLGDGVELFAVWEEWDQQGQPEP